VTKSSRARQHPAGGADPDRPLAVGRKLLRLFWVTTADQRDRHMTTTPKKTKACVSRVGRDAPAPPESHIGPLDGITDTAGTPGGRRTPCRAHIHRHLCPSAEANDACGHWEATDTERPPTRCGDPRPRHSGRRWRVAIASRPRRQQRPARRALTRCLASMVWRLRCWVVSAAVRRHDRDLHQGTDGCRAEGAMGGRRTEAGALCRSHCCANRLYGERLENLLQRAANPIGMPAIGTECRRSTIRVVTPRGGNSSR